MPRIVRTLSFEDTGFLNEPLLDTPIGKFTIRQTLVLFIFGAIGALIILQANLNAITETQNLIMVIVGAVVIAGGWMVFGRKIKTIAPEMAIFYMIFGGGGTTVGAPRTPRALKRGKAKREPETGPEAAAKPGGRTALTTTKIPNVVRIASLLDSPAKLIGVLRDPQSGRPLTNRAFEVFLAGERVFAGVTDENGFFVLFFTPTTYGTFNLELKAEQCSQSQKLPVQIVPERGGD